MKMSEILSNSWFQNIVAEVIGIILGLGAGYFLGKRGERKRLARQFYDGIEPVLKKLSEIRKSGRIAPEDARGLVQTISSSFQQSFLRDSSLLILKKDRYHKPGTEMDCGVCSYTVKLANDLCPNCSLDCCAWNAMGSAVHAKQSSP
jgi:hypothetical protein